MMTTSPPSPVDISARFRALTDHIDQIRQRCGISYPIDVVAATKYADTTQLREAAAAGIKIFGENRLQSAIEKRSLVSDLPVSWHYIGHVQTNKAAKIIQNFSLIHSVDSVRLLTCLQETAEKLNVDCRVLIQINSAREPQKHGFLLEEISEKLPFVFSLARVQICGIMCIAPDTVDGSRIRACFHETANLFRQIQAEYPSCQILSMGMTQDYPIAIEAGATMVRVGRFLFQN